MTQKPADDAGAPVQDVSIPLVLTSIGLLLLLAALDQTIVSTALPTILADIGGVEHLAWIITAYVLASTVSAPLYGKLGDLYGRRKTVFVSVGLFLLGSLACGASQSMAQMIAARALQGLGGGGLFVLALSVVGDVIPPRERGKVQGLFAAVFSVSSVIGPLIGGGLVQYVSWHWIFFINIPFGILAVIGFAAAFPGGGPRVSHRIDWAGAVALTVALASLTLVTSLGGHSLAWGSAQVLGLMALTVAAAVAFVLIEARAPEPILPLGLFRMNVFLTTSLMSLVIGAGLFSAVAFLPLYLQIAKAQSPTMSGLLLVPMTIGIVLATTVAGRYMMRTGRYRVLPIAGLASLGVGLGLLSRLTGDTALPVFSVYLLVAGFGMGLIFPVLTTAVQNAVPRSQLGTATASGLMFRQIGGSLGVAIFGAIFASRMTAQLGAAASGGGRLDPRAIAGLPPQVQERIADAVSSGLSPVYLYAALLCVAGLVVALLLREVPLEGRGPQAR